MPWSWALRQSADGRLGSRTWGGGFETNGDRDGDPQEVPLFPFHRNIGEAPTRLKVDLRQLAPAVRELLGLACRAVAFQAVKKVSTRLARRPCALDLGQCVHRSDMLEPAL